MAEPQVGEKLGRYRLLELVGQGGMASVYRAVDEDLDREVAIKVLHPHLESREDARLRFRREAKTIARIEHPNIVGIFDYSGEDADKSFIVTQYIYGPHLRKLLDDSGPFPPELAASMARQVAEGLLVAHADGIVHRDVKPENILVSGDGVVMVADFGIAHLIDTQDMTATGQILGSPYYMSPEQVQGKKLDARADMFSFGTLLYLLVTGKQAFDGPNPHAVLKRICEGEVDSPERLAPQAGQAMARLIESCLIKDRDQRPANLEPVIEQLDSFLQLSGIDDPVEEVRTFLADPDGYRESRKSLTVAALMKVADRLQSEGSVSDAMDLYNRVLAVEPEHSGALSRVSDVASTRSRRRLVTRVGVLLVAIAFVVVAIFGGPKLLARVNGDRAVESDAGTGTDMSSLVAEGKIVVEGQPLKKKVPPDVPPDEKTTPLAFKVKKPPIVKLKKPGGKAVVKFVPMPKTVIIWVDGKKVGKYFHNQQMELAVGKHTIRFEPEDTDCCEPAEWEVKILPQQQGDKPQAIGRRLTLKPATLMVYADKGAVVQIDGKQAGHAGKPISVPMLGSPVREIGVTVTAEGYVTVKKKVKLQAGKSKELPAIKMQPQP